MHIPVGNNIIVVRPSKREASGISRNIIPFTLTVTVPSLTDLVYCTLLYLIVLVGGNRERRIRKAYKTRGKIRIVFRPVVVVSQSAGRKRDEQKWQHFDETVVRRGRLL